MKHIIPTFLAIGALGLAPAIAQDCVNADPWLELGGVGGDFELRVDPQDPKQNLIFVANVADGASGIAAARINGASGQVMRGSLTPIADNYYGQSVINGPEFVQKPTGELGVVYAGPGGVHAVFRSTAPTPWNAFWFNADGKRIFGSPPPLPSTSDGAYPAPPIPDSGPMGNTEAAASAYATAGSTTASLPTSGPSWPPPALWFTGPPKARPMATFSSARATPSAPAAFTKP
jgi:hypothetical protein